jgi:hypothetical protein
MSFLLEPIDRGLEDVERAGRTLVIGEAKRRCPDLVISVIQNWTAREEKKLAGQITGPRSLESPVKISRIRYGFYGYIFRIALIVRLSGHVYKYRIYSNLTVIFSKTRSAGRIQSAA